MKHATTILIIVVAMSAGTANAQWGNSWGQQQNAADIIRATGEASSSVLAVIQNGKSQELAEREQKFQHEQFHTKQREIHYSEIPNTIDGRRASQRLANQLDLENRQMREALSASLQREEILVRRINLIDQENRLLREEVASLKNTLEEILKRLPPQQ